MASFIDPSCGTGGFLACLEIYFTPEHVLDFLKGGVPMVAQRERGREIVHSILANPPFNVTKDQTEDEWEDEERDHDTEPSIREYPCTCPFCVCFQKTTDGGICSDCLNFAHQG